MAPVLLEAARAVVTSPAALAAGTAASAAMLPVDPTARSMFGPNLPKIRIPAVREAAVGDSVTADRSRYGKRKRASLLTRDWDQPTLAKPALLGL